MSFLRGLTVHINVVDAVFSISGPLSEYMILRIITNMRRSITRMLNFVAFLTEAAILDFISIVD